MSTKYNDDNDDYDGFNLKFIKKNWWLIILICLIEVCVIGAIVDNYLVNRYGWS